MEYLDFSSVITIIRKYINDERTVVDRNLNEEVKIDQMHLLDQVFASFCDDADSLDFAFDNGEVCRWFNGQARISPRIISFYLDEENRDLLSADIEYNVLPLMYEFHSAVLSVVPEFYNHAFAITDKDVMCELFDSILSKKYNQSLEFNTGIGNNSVSSIIKLENDDFLMGPRQLNIRCIWGGTY